MSDKDQKLPADLFEVDWNDALSEWEKSSFEPEVVKDASAEKPAERGPVADAAHSDPFSAPTARHALTKPDPTMGANETQLPELDGEEDELGNETVIAVIPKELLRGAGKNAPVMRSTRGGLGQLFARVPDARDNEAGIDVAFEETPARSTPGEVIGVVASNSDADASVITSAKPVSVSRVPAAEPLKRPSLQLLVEPEADGGIFDPFKEPATFDAPTKPTSEAPAAAAPPKRQRPPATVPPEKGSSPSLHAPTERRFDPNEETFVVPKSRMGGFEQLRELDAGLDDGDVGVSAGTDASTDAGRVPENNAVRVAGVGAAVDAPPESPPPSVDEPTRLALRVRADWFETEARSIGDDDVRARQLLVVSEIWALVGDLDRAHALAVEAKTLAPAFTLAHKQARMGSVSDLPALEQELATAPTDAARGVGNQLLAAAERSRGNGTDSEAAAKRGEQFEGAQLSCLIEGIARDLPELPAAELQGRLANAHAAATLLSEAVATCRWLRGEKGLPGRAVDPTEAAFDSIEAARRAFAADDAVAAATALAAVSALPKLARAALWLSASLAATQPQSRRDSAERLLRLREMLPGQPSRALLCRAIELSDGELALAALSDASCFTPAERAIAGALFGRPEADLASPPDDLAPLAAAVAATVRPEGAVSVRRNLGAPSSQAASTIATLVANGSFGEDLAAACQVLARSSEELAHVVGLEGAHARGDVSAISDAVTRRAQLPASSDNRAHAHAAAGLVAEHQGDTARAAAAYLAAHRADPGMEGLLRAVAAFDRHTDLVVDLNSFAENVDDGLHSATLRIEAFARVDSLDDVTRLQLLSRAHDAAPSLPIAAFLAQGVARHAGSDEDVLFWLRERQTRSHDEAVKTVDSLREARLLGQTDKAAAATLVERAHRAAPEDLALRYWYERVVATDPLEDARFRERRAETLVGDTRSGLLLDAAYRFEAAAENAGAARAAAAADTGAHRDLARVARERSEINAGQVAGLAENLLALAKGTSDGDTRREAFERLAHVDAVGRGDSASALLWHRSILHETPRHLPSLRHLEHYLITEAREEELEPIASAIVVALANTTDPEVAGHAQLTTRLRLIAGDCDHATANELAHTLASSEGAPLWALRRALSVHRMRRQRAETVATSGRLLPRVRRPMEASHLLYIAAESAIDAGDLAAARDLLTRATRYDGGDVVIWELFEDLCRRQGDAVGAAEASERLAASSRVPEHQLVAWYNAGRTWADVVHQSDRAEAAFEHASEINLQFEDTYLRLRTLYAARSASSKLQTLLSRWRQTLSEPAEQAALELERAKLYLASAETEAAQRSFELALSLGGEDAYALGALADICAAAGDWDGAERAWVRLARLLPGADEQRAVYGKLGDLYAKQAVNLPRAVVAYGEIIRRAPGNVETLAKLLGVYRAQGDVPHAVEIAQQLLALATEASDRKARHLELAAVFEFVAKDIRKSEAAFDAARKEFPADVVILRALAEFYIRQRQTPAVNILLDRVSNEGRRAVSSGRLDAGHFEMLIAANELRGKADAARVVAATYAAIGGRPTDLSGFPAAAFDTKFDEALAPELVSPGFRLLLARTGDALDAVLPVDLRAVRATPGAQAAPKFTAAAVTFASSVGIANLQVLVVQDSKIACTPVTSSPPAILVTDAFANRAAADVQRFLLFRTLKVVQARAGALMRATPTDLPILVAAWLKTFNPSWSPTGIAAAPLNAMGGKLQAVLSRQVSPELAATALETASVLGARAPMVASALASWATRAALLAAGDPNAAFDALAAQSTGGGLPSPGETRSDWVARTIDARDLVSFSVTDSYADLRMRASSR